MDYKSAIETIVEVEQSFDVNSLSYDDLEIWPLIRLELWKKLVSGGTSGEKQISKSERSLFGLRQIVNTSTPFNEVVLKARRFLSFRKLHTEQLPQLRRNSPKEIAFFSRIGEHRDYLNGKLYNKFIDPIIDLIRGEFRFIKIELEHDHGTVFSDRYEMTFHLNPNYNIFRQRLFGQFIPQKHISNFDKFKDMVIELDGDIHLDERYFVNQTRHLKNYKEYFKEILTILRPRTVFFVCYYGIETMALVWCCRDMGIKTVDIQHGKQGKYHGLYTHWTKIPRHGYKLLPDFFWCWGEESKSNIGKWHPKGCVHHRPLVGGDRWLAKWAEGYVDEIDPERRKFYESLGQFDRVILVTLQTFDDPLPSHLVSAMRSSPGSWMWLIRLHPLQKQIADKICHIMRLDGIRNFEIERSTDYPLYELLRHISHHITCFSSVCYEALAFKIPTTIVHPVGLQLYMDYINKGIFYYAQNGDEVLRSITKSRSTEKIEEQEPYIVTNIEYAENAMNIILNHRL